MYLHARYYHWRWKSNRRDTILVCTSMAEFEPDRSDAIRAVREYHGTSGYGNVYVYMAKNGRGQGTSKSESKLRIDTA